MKKNTFTLASLAILAFAAILVAGCSGDDGAPGPAGTNGTNGTNGTAGTNGTNGTNGAGFDEAIAKGNIILYLDGTRPDGVAFKDTIDYRFASSNLNDSRFYDDTGEGEDSDISTEIERYQGFDGSGYAYTYAEGLSLTGVTEKLLYTYLNTDNAIVEFPAEHKFFYLWAYPSINKTYNSETEEVETSTNLTDLVITSYDYNVATTGKAVYKYSGTLDSEENSTGYDLKITVVVSASVYESVQSINEGGDRHQAGNGRIATRKVGKAEMQFMK